MKKHILILVSTIATTYAQIVDKIKDKATENKTEHIQQSQSQRSSQLPRQTAPNPTYSYPRQGHPTNLNGQQYDCYNPNSNYPQKQNDRLPYRTKYQNEVSNNNYSSSKYKRPSKPTQNIPVSSPIGNEQKRLLDMKDSIPEVSCIETFVDISTSINNITYIANPRLRLVRGIFATEFRYLALLEKPDANYNWSSYTNFDWQIIQFNILSKHSIKLRTGLGLTRDFYAKLNYFDWGASCEIYPIAGIKLKFDFRKNTDLLTEANPRQWLMFGGELRLKKDPMAKMMPYFGFNANYLIFFNEYKIFTIGPSLYIRFQ